MAPDKKIFTSRYSQNTLLPTDKIIELAKLARVNFGPGNPQERIRYFIKLGLLPYAVRKSTMGSNSLQNSAPVGHLPYWTVNRLIKINHLFLSGYSYPQIAEKLREPQPQAEAKTTEKVDNLVSEAVGKAPESNQSPPPAVVTQESKPLIGKITQVNVFSRVSNFDDLIAKKLRSHEQQVNKLLEAKSKSLQQPQNLLLGGNEPQTQPRTRALILARNAMGLVIITALVTYFGFHPTKSDKTQLQTPNLSLNESLGKVLAATSENHKLYIDAETEVLGITLFNEDITAPNIVYSVTEGTGINVTGGQNPRVSLDSTALVTAVNDGTGAITIKGSGGTSISNSGSTITVSSTSGLSSESDTLATVTGRGATTSTASTFSGGLTVGGNLSLSDTNSTLNITNTGSLAFKDGTNTLLTLADQGSYGTLRLSDKGSTSDPTTCTAGDIYFNGTDTTVKACTATNTWEALDTSLTLSGDTGTDQTITDANTIEIAGGTNGIDTVGVATDTVRIDLDTTEIGTTTFGTGSSIVWTFNSGTTTDPVLTFGDNALTIGSAATITATDVTAFNCTDCLDFDDLEDTLDLDTALTLNQTTNTWAQTFTGNTTTGLSYTANSLTTGTALDISSSGTITTTGELVNLTANSLTTGALLRLSATGLSSGTGIEYTGSTSTGITGKAVSIASDIGSAGSLAYLAPDFSGAGVTGYGLNITATDTTASGNTDYGIYSSLALTANAAKTGYGNYSTVTSNSTTADTIYGVYGNAAQSGANSSGTKNLYGLYGSATSTNTASGGTSNTYGAYLSATGDTGGTGTAYGLYSTASGGDLNYAGWFAGDVAIGKQTDSSVDWAKKSQTTAGTIAASGTASIAKISSMAVYNGSLYIGTKKTDAAEVYRFDGGTTWTRVSQSTAGTIAASGTANIDEVSAMTAFDGYLYIGTNEANSAEVYRYDGSTTWTRVSTSTPGTLLTTANIDGIMNLAVFKGYLYASTSESGAADTYRYAGGTTWVSIDTATLNETRLLVYDGDMYFMYGGGLSQAQVWRFNTTTSATRVTDTTSGTIVAGGTTAIDKITAAAVYNGSFFIGTSESNSAEIYRYNSYKWDTAGVNWSKVSQSTAGTIAASGTASIDGVTALTVYNGKLYAATSESNSAEIYRYDGGTTWTKVSQSTAGTIASGGTASIDTVSSLIPYNSELFAGTEESSSAEVYSYTAIEGQSFALKFNAASDNANAEQNNLLNFGSISFVAESQGNNNTSLSSTGTFVFSHGLATDTGAYDVAEDYPTRDETIEPGDLVSASENEKGFVTKSQSAYEASTLGIYSEKPGFRLSQKDPLIDGAKAIPVALVGRVPLKVTAENGIIRKGDSIASSSTQATGMKATKAGRVIGIALENLDCLQNSSGADCKNKILVYVNPTWYLGTNLASNGSINSEFTVNGSQSELADASMNYELLTTNLLNKDGTLQERYQGQILTADQIQRLIREEVAAQLAQSSDPGSQPSIPNLDPGSESAEATGSSLASEALAKEAQLAQETNQTLSELNELLSSTDLKLSTLTLTGAAQLAQTQVAGTFSQDGTLVIDYGQQINVLGSTLLVQNDSLAGNPDGLLISIGQDKVTIDSSGNLKITGTLFAKNVETKELTIDTSDSANQQTGSGTIALGQTQTIVDTRSIKPNAKVVVSAQGPTGGRNLYIKDKEPFQGFTVALENGPAINEIKFDWIIINTNQILPAGRQVSQAN